MSNTENSVKEIMSPYRKSIDELDKEIVDLLVERFKIIRKVAKIKETHNIPSVLQDRVDEVRNNAADRAESQGLNREFVYNLYTMMIDYACKLEDELINKWKLYKWNKV